MAALTFSPSYEGVRDMMRGRYDRSGGVQNGTIRTRHFPVTTPAPRCDLVRCATVCVGETGGRAVSRLSALMVAFAVAGVVITTSSAQAIATGPSVVVVGGPVVVRGGQWFLRDTF